MGSRSLDFRPQHSTALLLVLWSAVAAAAPRGPVAPKPGRQAGKMPVGGTSAACGSSMSCRGFRRLWSFFRLTHASACSQGFCTTRPRGLTGGGCVASVLSTTASVPRTLRRKAPSTLQRQFRAPCRVSSKHGESLVPSTLRRQFTAPCAVSSREVPRSEASGMNVADCCRGAAFFAFRLTDSSPVRANDFSQSCVEGPRMFPSM
jgi:hypothetical protein